MIDTSCMGSQDQARQPWVGTFLETKVDVLMVLFSHCSCKSTQAEYLYHRSC